MDLVLNNKRILYLKVNTGKPCGARPGLEMNESVEMKKGNPEIPFFVWRSGRGLALDS